MVSGGNDSMVKVWSISSGQTGAELKLIHSINVNVKAWFGLFFLYFLNRIYSLNKRSTM